MLFLRELEIEFKGGNVQVGADSITRISTVTLYTLSPTEKRCRQTSEQQTCNVNIHTDDLKGPIKVERHKAQSYTKSWSKFLGSTWKDMYQNSAQNIPCIPCVFRFKGR